MHFQSQHGKTKVIFDNQGKNTLQCDAFSIEIYLFKLEFACGKELLNDFSFIYTHTNYLWIFVLHCIFKNIPWLADVYMLL
jgi:hypothetical protein